MSTNTIQSHATSKVKTWGMSAAYTNHCWREKSVWHVKVNQRLQSELILPRCPSSWHGHNEQADFWDPSWHYHKGWKLSKQMAILKGVFRCYIRFRKSTIHVALHMSNHMIFRLNTISCHFQQENAFNSLANIFVSHVRWLVELVLDFWRFPNKAWVIIKRLALS